MLRGMKEVGVLRGLFIFFLIVTLSACSQSNEKKVQKHMQRGEDYLSAAKYPEAAIEFKNVVQIEPKSAKGRYNLAQAYINMGGGPNLQLAFSEFSKAVDLDPGMMDAQLMLGNMLLLSRAFDKSLEKAELVLKADPDDMDAMVLKATSLAGSKDIEGALSVIDRVLAKNPDTMKPYMAAAGIYMAAKRPEAAIAALKKASALEGGSLKPRLALASFYVGQKKVKDAEEELKKAVEENTESPQALIALGNFYASTKRLEEAEKTFVKTVELNPENPGAYIILAGFYLATKRFEDAQKTYEKGVGKNPDALILKARLAELLLDGNKPQEAAAHIESILKKQPKDFYGLYLRGRLRLTERKPMRR